MSISVTKRDFSRMYCLVSARATAFRSFVITLLDAFSYFSSTLSAMNAFIRSSMSYIFICSIFSVSILRALTESSYIKLLEIFESVFDKLLETLRLEARGKLDPLCMLETLL